MSARKKLLAIAAAVTMWAVIQPGIVYGQNSGLGGDGFTRLLWRATNYSVALWKLDANLNFLSNPVYGPYVGWTPVALTTAANNFTYVLWTHTDGHISLWKLDANLNFLSSQQYGPYVGWLAKGLSAGASNFRVIWRYYDGSVSLWNVDSNLNFVANKVYGPYFGYDPGYTD